MLECKNVPYLLELYKKFGFNVIDKDYKDNELLQLVRIFNEEEIKWFLDRINKINKK